MTETAAPMTTMACKDCGEQISQKAEICPKCGVRQRKPADKAILLVITFLLGGIGMHKFYLRQYAWGIVYLLFSVTGIPALVALIEFFIYLFTSAEKIEEKYTSSASAVLIAVLAAFFFIMIIGILAAIAVPAYQGYIVKAKVVAATEESQIIKQKIEYYITTHNRYPADLDELGIARGPVGQHIAEVRIGDNGVFEITLSTNAAAAAGETIIYQPTKDASGLLQWDCTGGTLARHFRHGECLR